jgi:four helix bundle protein
MVYDLEGRTKKFSIDLMVFLKSVERTDLNKNIIIQLARSGTSIGANYSEANGSCSKKEFVNKISIAAREARETKYWIEILSKCGVKNIEILRCLWKEAHKLSLIFSKISSRK